MKYACRTQYRHGKGSTKEEKTRKEFEQSKAFFIIHNIQDSFLCMNVVESLLKGPAAGGASSPPLGLFGGWEGGTLARSVCRGGWAKREGGRSLCLLSTSSLSPYPLLGGPRLLSVVYGS